MCENGKEIAPTQFSLLSHARNLASVVSMKSIVLFLMLFTSCAAFAEGDAQDKLGQLEAELKSVRHEQQSVYQNYQMTRDLRLMEVQEGLPPQAQYPYGKDINTPPPNYDEVMRAQMEHEKNIRQYTDELKALAARYLELEEKRKALLEQIKELKRQQQDGLSDAIPIFSYSAIVGYRWCTQPTVFSTAPATTTGRCGRSPASARASVRALPAGSPRARTS
jgi:flagellar motility protein MotE (MotC chaperone)